MVTTAQWHKSACNLCYINCGIEVLVEEGRIIKVRGDRDHPKSQGYLCNKAARIPYYVHHRDRLTSPLRRRADGSFEPIGWDDAISEIAQRLRLIIDRYGGKSLALYGGGGQGNHAGGLYANAFLRALGSRNVFNALSQEKTGDFWLNGHMFGSQTCHTAEDVEHCDLLFVIGANPWVAHGFANARDQLNRIRKDPARKLIVIDPRRSETAAMADVHVALRPGTDAFFLGALLSTLVRREAVDQAFLAEHTLGFDEVGRALLAIPVAAWAAAAEVSLAEIERCADLVAAAQAMVVRVELGIQQSRNSTLNSYLEKLLIMLTGSFGRRGTNQLHSWLQPLWGNSRGQSYAPTGDEVIAGLLPPNSFPRAVLGDHPERLRAVWVDSSNPANTAANTAEVERALRSLELCVTVDVAMTETARLSHYVLPAASQFEKTEFTFFTFEFPTNYFHVRAGVLPPLAGTLPEPEIYARLARALGLLPDEETLAPLCAAAARARSDFTAAFRAFLAERPGDAPVASLILYQTLGRSLPDGVAAAAPLWAAAQSFARRAPDAARRALAAADGVADAALGDALFDAVVGARQGAPFSRHAYDGAWSLVEHADRKIRLVVPGMLEWLVRLDPAASPDDPDFPFVLSAGQRRMFNANQIFRDPAWRRDDPDGALLIHPLDLASLGVESGGWLVVESASGRLLVRCKADDSMRRGHVVLPHGFGQAYPTAEGERLVNGPRINLLTASDHRDPIAGTPYHKQVAVRLSPASATEAPAAEAVSQRLHRAVMAS